jgi:hypothetical protein
LCLEAFDDLVFLLRKDLGLYLGFQEQTLENVR